MGVVEDERERMRIYELLSAPIPCIAGTTKCNIHVSYLFDFASLLVYQKRKKKDVNYAFNSKFYLKNS